MASNPHDVRIRAVRWHALPVKTRVPLKFGRDTLTEVVCARVCLTVSRADGTRAQGWGETPLSVQWVWPSALSYAVRLNALQDFCDLLAEAYAQFPARGHAMEIGHDFLEAVLPALLKSFNETLPSGVRIPKLAALVCASAFDLALHDAYGVANEVPTYETYRKPWMNHDLAAFLQPATDAPAVSFADRYPADYFRTPAVTAVLAWHLVGGLDFLTVAEAGANRVPDAYPSSLDEWIRRDGLQALKVKLRGDDAAWDFERLRRVAEIGLAGGVRLFTADFNCTVTDPAYVNGVLDRVKRELPELWSRLSYVEQPFPYELEAHRIDVHSVSARCPLFLDESAHDWRVVRLGRELGWTGVALKTCKTQTGALLSLCWARAHGMQLMVQDLTNPMLAQVTHVLLGLHAPTIAGVETNGMQFYPAASAPEARVHPGLYLRRDGHVDAGTVAGPGFGYRLDEMTRELPAPRVSFPA
jgi:L-alanine-DL-glutamate epimerase-like enolase superfamily enzyme